MPPKKILFIYYQNIKPNGVSKVLSNLTSELAEKGYEVEVLYLMAKHDDFYKMNPKVKKHYIDSFKHSAARLGSNIYKKFKSVPKTFSIYSYLYDYGSYRVLREWLVKNHHQYDTIITCWYKLSSMLSLDKDIAPKVIAWEHMSHISGGLFWKNTLRRFYKNLKAVVSTNKPNELNKRTCTIYNLMDNNIEIQPHIDTSAKQNIISVVARLEPEKNVAEFVDIISESHIPDNWKIKIIGTGREEKKIEQKIVDKNLSDKIELLGNRNMDEVYNLLKISKINCLTSKGEALPTILIQAMFFSNALMAYDCPYGPSDIINKKNGLLIKMHDKESFKNSLEVLTHNEELLSQINTSSYLESRNWKREKILAQWENIL